MNSKEFLKTILSKKVPLFMFFLNFITGCNFGIRRKEDGVFFLRFILISFSLIVIVECVIAFCRTIWLLKGMDGEYSKIIRFRLLALPYLPACMGTVFYGAFRIVEYRILYQREFIIVLGGSLLVNFISSAIYNCKVHTVEHIQYSHNKEKSSPM